jgi:SAM-dependent methyltransferase
MWKIKVLIQFILSKIPMGEKINFVFQKMLSRHSLPNTESRIIYLAEEISSLSSFLNLKDISVVEIGTGWDAINPILLYVLGAKSCHTFDHVSHIRFDLAKFVIEAIKNSVKEISKIASISENALIERVALIDNSKSIEDLFARANIFYHAPGDASSTGLPEQSVDLVYSYAVLEHVPPRVVVELTKEAKRILKQDGFAFHVIGLHDHYSNVDRNVSKVNFLKYSEKAWSFFVYNNISYHNRLREKSFVEMFLSCGARIASIDHDIDQKDILELQKMKVDRKFSGFTPEELAVHKSRILLSFPEN